jgi:predicted tellurium resistance membrane protein TerC
MDWLIALVTLTALEIVLGIDNIIFISILCGRLKASQRAFARTAGLAAAMITRLLLLLSLSWVLSLTEPILQLTDLGVPESWLHGDDFNSENELKRELARHSAEEINDISIRDLILLIGGLFLIGNSVIEIHHKLEGHEDAHEVSGTASLWGVLFQIAILDIIFSLDSVITAVGMAKQIWVMAAAIVLAVMVMMLFAGAVERFVSKYQTVKMLALSFLILIGVLLVAEGIGTPVNKGYIYFAMAFALAVEMLNIRIRGRVPASVPVSEVPA